MNKSSPSSFRLGAELENELSILAEALDIPRSLVVKKAVKHFIARQKHMDEVFAMARERYAEFESDGMGVPLSEAADWFASGGQGPIPAARNLRK